MLLMTLADIRREYVKDGLREQDVAADAIGQFMRWFDEAVRSEVPDVNAMTLATVGEDGRPAARIVLLKGCDSRGFTFYTNYQSQKGRELARVPHATLVFFWPQLDRQVRITGITSKLSREESQAYARTRPRASQIAAWASTQSSVIASRQAMEQRFEELEKQFAALDQVPVPEHWGGYLLEPDAVEFWQGRPSRLHDRLLYQQQAPGKWRIQRLAP